jgi:hypothetical protein
MPNLMQVGILTLYGITTLIYLYSNELKASQDIVT